MNYIDTSVIMAALDPLDPRQRSARAILEGEEDKAVSELVLAELASVLARRGLLPELSVKLNLKENLIIPTLLLYLIKRFKLLYGRVDGGVKIPVLGELYSPIAVAINLSVHLKLKTLDMLHVAYAKLLKDQGKPINSLITADEDFEKANQIIENMLKIKMQILRTR